MGPEKEEAVAEAYEKLLAIFLNQAPLDGIEDLVVPDVMGFGTNLDEKVHDLEGYINLIRGQEEEAKNAGLDFSFEPERIHQRISPANDAALFVEQIIATLKSEGEIVHQFNARLSVLMELIDAQWKLVHWHGSVPTETENDTWHIRKFEREKERLEKLIAEQTTDLQQKNRELEIEAATQRVRAVAMGMQEPDDIMNVLNVMREEIGKFELGNIATWIWTQDEEGWITQWDISEVIHEGNLAHFNFTFDPKKYPQVSRHTKHWDGKEACYELHWNGKELQELIHEVNDIDKNSGTLFQDAVDSGQISEYWQMAAPYRKGIVGLDFVTEPPGDASPILTKMADTFGMAYQRFEDLKKAEAQAREAKIELSLERIRAQATGMQQSSDLLDIVVTMHAEFVGLGHEAHYFWHMRWLPDTYEKAMTSSDGSRIGNVMELPRGFHENKDLLEWEQNDEPVGVFTLPSEKAVEYVDKMISMGRFDEIDQNAPGPDDIRSIGGLTFVMARTTHGEIGYSLPGVVENPPAEDLETLVRFAAVFDLAYRRYEDLKKAEQQAYESKVEASLERVRGMAAAMNHSDDLMQIAEEMFKELEILKINPLRYGLGMIDGEKKEAELWASTVNDGHYLDMLGTLSLTWHPMLQQVLDAWDAQHEEVIYELKGKELSDYYQKIGEVNPDIPNLKVLQDPKTEITQYVSFFPFKSGALYAFTDGEPGEEGRSILKRFANVFEQAHIRYDDLQKAEKQARLIREERDRLEIALKELEATKDQLVQQEKLASLGQLTAGIAHEIKNPLNFVNNFSELSVELIEEAREEIKEINSKFNIQNLELSDLLDDIETNLKKIYEHGSRADSIVKSMLEHSRGGSGKMEPTDLNALVKEFVNLTFHGMRAGKNPINVDMEFELDESIGEVPLIAEDFSRVIINLCNNGFDAMKEKLNSESRIQNSEEYKPKLTIRTQQQNSGISIEIEDNGPGIPEEMKDKILQPFFTTKKGTQGTGLGLSITNDIVKAHGGILEFNSKQNIGSQFIIQLNQN